MGRASFRCADLPMTGADEWIERPLAVGDRHFVATCVSVGNPHAVVFGQPLDEDDVRRDGPQIETHRQFPRRTNVQFIEVVDRGTVRALIWERGAGYTQASGSSACAVAAACVRTGRVDRDVQVVMPGGSLRVRVLDDFRLEQTGTAQEIATGRLSPDLVSALQSLSPR